MNQGYLSIIMIFAPSSLTTWHAVSPKHPPSIDTACVMRADASPETMYGAPPVCAGNAGHHPPTKICGSCE